jgi:hypothetical protein
MRRRKTAADSVDFHGENYDQPKGLSYKNHSFSADVRPSFVIPFGLLIYQSFGATYIF